MPLIPPNGHADLMRLAASVFVVIVSSLVALPSGPVQDAAAGPFALLKCVDEVIEFCKNLIIERGAVRQVDDDSDGDWEEVSFDFDRDGDWDLQIFDNSNDGLADMVVVDKDSDGDQDAWMQDENWDGKFDWVWVDKNGDNTGWGDDGNRQPGEWTRLPN